MNGKRTGRREFLQQTGLAAGAAALAAGAGHAAGAEKPNIIFIMADDLGWNELGCYGQEKIQTPNIDQMAAEGMRFTQYYAGSPVCAPSRCILLTGKHGGHAYVRDNHAMPPREDFAGQLPLPAEEETFAEILKRAGYVTGCFGKWGLGAPGSPGDPLKQGFDRFYGYNCQSHAHNLYPRFLVDQDKRVPLEGNTRGLTGDSYAPQCIADKMLDFVRENRQKPFFLYYPTVIPHLALQVPEKDLAQYRGRWEETPYTGKRYLPHPAPKACYAAMISFLDRQVGRLFKLLEELGLAENTIVIFTSDNGTTHLKDEVDYEFFESTGPLRGLKGSLYEGGIRVPMIAWQPGKIPADTVSNHIAAHYDVPATLAEIAGATPPDNDGISFRATLLAKPEQQKAHDFLFWDFPGYGGQIAARSGKWKAMRTGMQKNPDAPLELYNLEEDISESRNVAEKYPDVAARMAEIMIEARTPPRFGKFRFGKYGQKPAE
jgi:arylsulfatase A